MNASRNGFGLVEAIVALVLLSVGLLGLVGTAVVAQRSFNRAAAVERSARIAGALIDSLLTADHAVDGARTQHGVAVSWTVSRASGLVAVTAEIVSVHGAASYRSRWEASRAE